VLVVIRSLEVLNNLWTSEDVGSVMRMGLDRTRSGLLCDVRGVG